MNEQIERREEDSVASCESCDSLLYEGDVFHTHTFSDGDGGTDSVTVCDGCAVEAENEAMNAAWR
jgi:hypothetical protein